MVSKPLPKPMLHRYRPLASLCCLLLVAVTLAACGGDSGSTIAPGPALGDIPPYPRTLPGAQPISGASALTVADYKDVQTLTFASPDDGDTIRKWYKQQLGEKGWSLLQDTPNLLILTADHDNRIFELLITSRGSSSSIPTRALIVYGVGRKPTPTP